jgi:hypothetical protein
VLLKLVLTCIAEFDARLGMIRTILAEAVERSIPQLAAFSCTGVTQSAIECFQVLREGGLWPLLETLRRENIAAAFKKIMMLEEPKRHFCTNTYCTFCKDKRYSFRGKLWNWKEVFSSAKIGLCLDCVRTGRRSFRDKECRTQHQ